MCHCELQGYEPCMPCITQQRFTCSHGFECPPQVDYTCSQVHKCQSDFSCASGFTCSSVYWQWDQQCTTSWPYSCENVFICQEGDTDHFGCPPGDPAHYVCHMPAGYECLNVYGCDNLYICPPEGTFLCPSTFHCQNDHECDHDPDHHDFACPGFYSCNPAGGTFECTPGDQFRPCREPDHFQCTTTFDCDGVLPYTCNGESYECGQEYEP